MKIKQATKQGYIEVPTGGVFNYAYPDSKLRRGRVIDNGNITPTLQTTDSIGVLVIDGKEIRARDLTPRERWRLQGFPDEYFDRARPFNSDSALNKQAGNSVTVNVIEEIARGLTE